jgi:hypothetical protein
MAMNKRFECKAINQSQSGVYKQKNFRVFDTRTKKWWNNKKNIAMSFYEAELIASGLNNGSILP